MLGESLLGLAFGSKLLFATRVGMACSFVGAKLLQNMWVGPCWEGVWLCLDPWDSVRLRTASTLSRCSREVWAAWRALFFFLIKEPVAVSNEVPYKPFVSAETLKACALVGLYLLAAESEEGSSGSQSSD